MVKRFVDSNTQSVHASAYVSQQNYYCERDVPSNLWHLPRTVRQEFRSMSNPDTRDQQSCGKFNVLRDGEQWENRRAEDGDRVEKVECLESTQQLELR